MTSILKLSVSKTKTFIDCKKKYNYVYNLKLPRKEFEYHTFGKFCHKVLEDFHNAYIINKSEKPFNVEMGIAFKAASIEYKEKMTPEMKKECWEIINQYLKLITSDKKNNLSANVIACEKNFDLVIDGRIQLNGMIDRIQIDSDGVPHVADYKTTKNKKYLKDDWFQLLTYAYILLSEDPSIKKVRASYILLRHNFEYITKEFSASEILKVKDKYLDYANEIDKEVEFPANPKILCRYCEYAPLCVEGKAMLEPSKIYGEVDW
jgi:RecB family exonuclease